MIEIKITFDPNAAPNSNIRIDWPKDKPALTISLIEDALTAVKRFAAVTEMQKLVSGAVQVPNGEMMERLLCH